MRKKGRSAGKSPNGASDLAGLGRLERIFALMSSHEIVEIDWEKDGERIHVRTRLAGGSPVAPVATYAQAAAVPPIQPAAQAVTETASGPAPSATPANHKQVVSPFVGTFYRASSPTTDPYVRESQSIKRGDVLCIIEAMKLMNEIEAEFSGKIVSILVENGQAVEFGEPLFVIET